MVLQFKNIFRRTPEQMRTAQKNVEQALHKLDSCAIDPQVREVLWDRYRETTKRYEVLSAAQSKMPGIAEGSPEVDADSITPPTSSQHLPLTEVQASEQKVLCKMNVEDGGSLVWTISTPPDDPIPISLAFEIEAPPEEKDIPTIMMSAGDSIVETAVEKARNHQAALGNAEIREYFAESFDRLHAQRQKMDSYGDNLVALDIASRLYFADAFGFLRRVMLILEITTPHHSEDGEAVEGNHANGMQNDK